MHQKISIVAAQQPVEAPKSKSTQLRSQTTSVTMYGTCVCLETGIPQHSTLMRPKECQQVGETGDVSVQSSKLARMLHSVLTMKGKIKWESRTVHPFSCQSVQNCPIAHGWKWLSGDPWQEMGWKWPTPFPLAYTHFDDHGTVTMGWYQNLNDT